MRTGAASLALVLVAAGCDTARAVPFEIEVRPPGTAALRVSVAGPNAVPTILVPR